jgi:hypothetical protein
MNNKQNEVTRNDSTLQDGEFFMVLGWLTALSVSISAALTIG